MPLVSAGILLYRWRDRALEVLLVHFGGPFWERKDAGAWAIPKGVIEPGEDAAAAARREFREELGAEAAGTLRPLARIRQKGGKWVEAFMLEGDFDPATLVSTSLTIEWPPRSGRFRTYPEVDRAAWFSLDEAREQILPSQLPLLDALLDRLK